MLLIGAGVAAVLAVVGYAVVLPAIQPTVSTSLPDQRLPVVTGPAPSASPPSASAEAAAGSDTGNAVAGANGANGDRAGSRSSDGRNSASPATPASTGLPTTPATAGTTTPATAPATTTAAAPPADLIPPSPLVAAEGALTSGNGLCLDLRGGEAGDGQEVHVDDCNGTSPQRWRLNDDKTLEVLDMCAYLVGDGSVELTGCDTRTTAQWSITDDGQVTNAANGRCLTDPFFGGRPGNQVVVARCVGSNNQRWSFR